MLEIVEMSDQTVTQVPRRVPLSLHTGDGWVVRIDNTVTLTEAGGDRRIVEGNRSTAPQLVEPQVIGRIIESVAVGTSEGLRIRFEGGVEIAASAAPDSEAWSLLGPAGQRIVCLPGGELAFSDADGST